MKSRLIALVNVVVYAIFMVLCVLLGNSGKKQRNENNNATKSKLQKQDTVVGVMFPKRRDTEMVKAIVKYEARRYDASVPPGTKIGDEVEILLHKGYVIHSSFLFSLVCSLLRS
jgi:membrane protein implicated in regulation of membrane protease activity